VARSSLRGVTGLSATEVELDPDEPSRVANRTPHAAAAETSSFDTVSRYSM